MANSSVRDTALAFLGNIRVEKTANYVARGRGHQGLTDGELLENWVAGFKAWAQGGSMEQDLDDLGAELELRDIDPPLDAVEAEVALLQKRIQEIGTPTPEALEALGEELDAFLRAKDKPSN